MAQKTIAWDQRMLKRFKAAQKAAVARKEESFIFDDNEFDVKYSKYLIEYLDGQFKSRN